MSIRDLIKKLRGAEKESMISWRVDPEEGLDFIINTKALKDVESYAVEDPLFGMQMAYLRGSVEQGRAHTNANGFTIASTAVPELGEDFVELFDLPPLFPGQYVCSFRGNTAQSAFTVSMDLVLPGGEQVSSYSLAGPFLKLSENEYYRLSPADWNGLYALNQYWKKPQDIRSEYENNWLIFQLQLAKKAGMKIDLAHFNNLELSRPESIGVAVEELENGDIIINPTFGAGMTLESIKARMGQLAGVSDHCILRVKDKFVLLDEQRIQAVNEILTRRRIPRDQVATFLKAPTAYLNAALIDLDTGFSLRVHGAEKFTHRYFGDIEKSGIDWFSAQNAVVEPIENLHNLVSSVDVLTEIEGTIADALNKGADSIIVDGRTFDISDPQEIKKAINTAKEKLMRKLESGDDQPDDEGVPTSAEKAKAVLAIDSNDDELGQFKKLNLEALGPGRQVFTRDNLKRQPYPHQEEGIQWLLAHMARCEEIGEDGGALLADDMGLGKTYMALVAISEWYRRCAAKKAIEKPTLIVAPLSLLENWQAEVDETFHRSPFSDIVVLQVGGDLSRYRVKGSGRETLQEFAESEVIEDHTQIRYSLKIGGVYGSDRLDMPGRLVLTTYQTLRDYQFSLSRVDWGIAAFDEAQNLKNPNALATRAAKGLKADFKLLATGTPVENSLKDFWCLMDTSVPGLLGSWQAFRAEYVAPIIAAESEGVQSVKVQVGRLLRSRVGEFMLRRTKAEKLQGLPEKRIFTGDVNQVTEIFLPQLARSMAGAQLNCYDDIINKVKTSSAEDKRGLVLPSLQKLKTTSIHHAISDQIKIAHSKKDFLKHAQSSCKIDVLIGILKEIHVRGEKVLIFATTKSIQTYVAALIGTLYAIRVDIINGETNAVATKSESQTRKTIIDNFQSKPGFGVIVMSPIAAGVGLTVVGANNVIHLERHWNPAKEAQATDRVYRIGQKRAVNVYLPMALHPEMKSFDLQLSGFLANKIDLSDAVVAQPDIQPADLAGMF